MKTGKKNDQKAIPLRPKVNLEASPSSTVNTSTSLDTRTILTASSRRTIPQSLPLELHLKMAPDPGRSSERIHELERVAPFYESTIQKENIAAAILWRSQFIPDEICPEGLVFFQKGRMIGESEVRLEDGIPWREGCEDEMVGDR